MSVSVLMSTAEMVGFSCSSLVNSYLYLYLFARPKRQDPSHAGMIGQL